MSEEVTMKKFALAISLVLASLSGKGEYATIDVHVFDADTGEAIPGIKVRGEFWVARRKPGEPGWTRNAVEAVTDSNGCCRVRGVTDCGRAKARLGASPEGYYPAGADIDYETTGETEGDEWLPKVLSQEVPLQRRGKGVPLIVKTGAMAKIESGELIPLSKNGEKASVGYDLFEGDLVAPYGEGKVADLVFTTERRITGVEDHDPRNPKAKRLEFYSWHHTFSVPGKGNGIRALRPNPFLAVRLRNGVDEGLSESVTRKTGLEKLVEEDGWYPVPFGEEPDGAVVYAMRLRSEFDRQGNLTKAYYAMIKGESEICPSGSNGVLGASFRYYLNPKANDRNLEWNGTENLDPDCLRAKRGEEVVEVPVPAHDPERAAALVQKAIDERSRYGGRISIGPGEIEMAPLVLRTGIKLVLKKGTTLLASTNAAHYAAHHAFIYAENAHDLGITGFGTIDGRGWAFREREGLPGESQPVDAPILGRFVRCRNLNLSEFKFCNAAAWGLHVVSCQGVVVRRVKAFCHTNHSNDGLDIESRDVLVEGCEFDTDDDALVFKSESDPAFDIRNVRVRDCTFRSCCNAIKFGTGSYGRWHDIGIVNCKVERPTASWRFDWRRPSREWPQPCEGFPKPMPGVTNALTGLSAIALEVVDGGQLENVWIRNIDIRSGVQTPIFIRMGRRHPPKQGRETFLRNVEISNVKGAAESRIACSITGLPDLRPSDIRLVDIDLTFPGGGTAAEAAKEPRECEADYPDPYMFDQEALPAWGFYIRHADDLRFCRVNLSLSSPDDRPRLVTRDARGFKECTDWRP